MHDTWNTAATKLLPSFDENYFISVAAAATATEAGGDKDKDHKELF